jgi:hypothetical protein
MSAYRDKCSAEEAHLIIFDRTKNKLWKEKLFVGAKEFGESKITVRGM